MSNLQKFLFESKQGNKIFAFYFKVEEELTEENSRIRSQNEIINRSTESFMPLFNSSNNPGSDSQ